MPEDEQFTGWGGERGPDCGDTHPQWRHPQGQGQGQGLPQFPRQTPPPSPEKGKAVKAALIFGPVVALLVFGALWVGGVIGDDPVPKDPVAAEHDWRTVPTIETTPDMSIKPGFRMGSTTKNILNRVDSLPAAEACSIPRFVNTDQVAAERTVRAMVDCAARSWRPVLDRILEPRFIQDVDQVWTITEPKPYEFTCTMVALQDKSFYCPGEETGITIRADQQASVGDLLTTVTHEYGHHIQELAGIASGATTEARGIYTRETGDERNPELGGADGEVLYTPNERLVWRRLESQANCFTGITVRAIAPQFLEDALAWMSTSTENPPEEDHPNPANARQWFITGFNAKSVADCNTWVAPVEQIQ